MLVHVRLTVPADLTPQVRELLLGHECATNVTLVEGASLQPEGDLIECDVAREQASRILDELLALGVGERGGVLLSTPSRPQETSHSAWPCGRPARSQVRWLSWAPTSAA